MAKTVATLLAFLFLFALNLLQFRLLRDVIGAVDLAKKEAVRSANAAVAASDAQFRAQQLERALRELRAAVDELEAVVTILKARVDAVPAEVKKEVLDEAKALIPPPAPAVDEDLIRSSIMMLVNDGFAEQKADVDELRASLRAELARLEKRLLVEMKDKKDQSFHVKQPLALPPPPAPVDEPTAPASPDAAVLDELDSAQGLDPALH